MRTIGVEERRDRLARRHRLAPGSAAGDPLEVATSLVALHATDPATVHLSIAARTGAADVAPAEAALYDDRTLVRLLGMRRTMWVVPAALVPVVQASSTAEVAAKERKRLIQVIEQAGLAADGRRVVGRRRGSHARRAPGPRWGPGRRDRGGGPRPPREGRHRG